MFCKNCGSELTPDSKFCKYCGTLAHDTLETHEVQSQPPYVPHPSPYPAQGQSYAPIIQKKKNGCLITILVIVGIFALLIAFAIFNGGEINVSTANLSNPKIASQVDPATLKPLDEVATFTYDAPIIYASVLSKNAPEGTKITAKWTYVPDAYEIATVDVMTTEVNQYATFNLTKPEAGFPLGAYTVQFFLNDDPSYVLNFTVE